MRFCNRAFPLALGIWLLSPGAPASAQADPGQWVGDLYMVGARFSGPEGHTSWAFFDGADKARRAFPNIANAADFPEVCQSCGSDAWRSYWHGDALYTLAGGSVEEDGEGREFSRHVFAKWEDGEWRLLGTLKTPRQPINFVPCDNGRFIVVSGETDLFDDRRRDRSPFCVAAVREGQKELSVVSSIDHGQDGLRAYMANKECFGLAWLSDVIVTDGRATLVNRDTGLYWVFSTETARLVKAGGIFKGVTPEMAAGGALKSRGGVLCANPEKAGTVLLSAQDEGLYLAETENAWREARELWDSVPWEQRTEDRDAQIAGILVRRLGEVRARSPLVAWHRIHPENGRLERLDAPPEGGNSLRGSSYDDCWRPMPDGSVKVGWDPHWQEEMKAQVAGLLAGGRGEGDHEWEGAGGAGTEGGVAEDGGVGPEGEPRPAGPGQADREGPDRDGGGGASDPGATPAPSRVFAPL